MTCNLNISGIYCLYYETDNDLFYIGQSINIKDRFIKHCNELSRGIHYNWMLQENYNKYGEPSIEILEKVYNPSILSSREVHWVSIFDSYYNGMNQTLGGESNYGETNPWALYTKKVYLDILKELISEPLLTYKQIATKLKVSDRVVGTIAMCTSHKWLEFEAPEDYSKLLKLKNTRNTKLYTQGVYYDILYQLASTNNTVMEVSAALNVSPRIVERISLGQSHLDLKIKYPALHSAMLGKIGTKKVTARRKEPYPKIVSPEGVIYDFSNARQFAREHDLQQTNLISLVNRKIKSHKGWKLYNGT